MNPQPVPASTSGLGGAAGFGLLNPGSLGAPAAAPAAAVPSSAAGGGGFPDITVGGGWTAPDYASLIQNDPAFMQLKNTLSASGISDA
ncbi:MAG: hypothetical protein ACYDCH_13720, partial [Gaiellaceae bacterium]